MTSQWESPRPDPSVLFGVILNVGSSTRGRANAVALGLDAGEIRYYDLGALQLTVEEKTYWCKLYSENSCEISLRNFARRYNLPKTNCHRWHKIYAAGIPIPDTFSRSRLYEESTTSILRQVANLKKVQPLLKSITGEKSIRAPVPIEKVLVL